MGAITDKKLAEHAAQFRDKSSEIGKDVQDLGKITNNLFNDAANVAQANVNELYTHGKARANQLSHDVGNKINEKPLLSLLVAAGVGLVIGALFNRRS